MQQTTEQLAAIRESGNLIVSAAAGAGKTMVLTERVAMRITEGTEVPNILVLTFTRAAAAEMKARIRKRLTELANEATDPKRRAYLKNQVRLVDGAYISTVHAFCARVLKRHYHVAGLSSDARIADETETAVIIEQVKDALLTQLSVEENADWLRLLAAFGGEDAAWRALMSLNAFLLSQPDPNGWLAEALGRYDGEQALQKQLAAVTDACKQELSVVIDGLTAARDALPPDWGAVIGVLDDDLMRYRAMLLSDGYDAYRSGVYDMAHQTLRFPRGTAEAEKRPAREPRELGKAMLKAQKERLRHTAAEELAAMRSVAPVLAALAAVWRMYDHDYTEKKRAKSLMDYGDLEHLTLKALANPAVAAEYRARFSMICVDEYQDSNRVQEAILNAIRRDDNVFLVGDVKQSIYRFRLAEPTLFLEKLGAFTGERGRRIDLNQNFRSARGVLDAVNDTFAAIMTERAGEMDYDERARLTVGNIGLSGGAELHIIERTVASDDGAAEPVADAEAEARLIAARIQACMQHETILDAGVARRPSYGDFAVLMRSATHARTVAHTLARCGVPCYVQRNGGYFDSIEVQMLLNFLRVIDNRRQDVPLLSVMRASIGDFSSAELVDIRTRRRDGAFYEALTAAANDDDALGRKARAFLDLLERYRAESRLIPVEQLIGMLLDETGFYEEMGASVNGASRQANLDALLAKAHAFEAGGGRGIWSFVRHMDLAGNNASFGAAETAGADVVRLLTIHKSKGLEYPIVFVCQLGARFNLAADSPWLMLHGELGLGARRLENQTMLDTAMRKTIVARLRSEQLSEEMRVLYVAMTRAKQRLILIGCMNNAAERLADAPTEPSPLTVLSQSSPLAWLLMNAHRALPVTVHEKSALAAGLPEEHARTLPPPDPAAVEALEARFRLSYDFGAATVLPAKVAVSRIGEAAKRLPVFETPAFAMRDQAPSGAFIGTAVHAALQYLPSDGSLRAEDIPAWLDGLAKRGVISPEQAAAADRSIIGWFLESDLWRRICQSPRVERELSFSVAVDVAKLFETEAQERILLQGVIDCCFMENGKWVIVDYKTDRVPENARVEPYAMRHAAQVRWYAEALEKLTATAVSSAYVVMLRAKASVDVKNTGG